LLHGGNKEIWQLRMLASESSGSGGAAAPR
jgi:hypothetical protein